MWTPQTCRCMANRKGGFSTATTIIAAICLSMFSVANTCCAPACGKQITTRPSAAWRTEVKIVLRGDSGYCRNELMSRCEGNKVDFVFGLAPIRSCVRSFLPTENAALALVPTFPGLCWHDVHPDVPATHWPRCTPRSAVKQTPSATGPANAPCSVSPRTGGPRRFAHPGWRMATQDLFKSRREPMFANYRNYQQRRR